MSRGPRWKRASTEVLALVTGPEIVALVGRPLAKDQALLALAARQKLAQRMRQHGWPATETATAAGVTWHEIDTARGYWPGLARGGEMPGLSRGVWPKVTAGFLLFVTISIRRTL